MAAARSLPSHPQISVRELMNSISAVGHFVWTKKLVTRAMAERGAISAKNAEESDSKRRSGINL
jgi:hypothetical protein